MHHLRAARVFDVLALLALAALLLLLFFSRFQGDVPASHVWPVSPVVPAMILVLSIVGACWLGRAAPFSTLASSQAGRFALQVAVLMLCLPLIKFWPVWGLAQERLCIGLDLHGMAYPLRDWFAQVLWRGGPTGWVEGVHGGYPLLANPHTAAFYPVHWLQALCLVDGRLPYGSVEFLVLIHLSLAGMGTVYTARVLGLERGPALLCGMALTLTGALNAHAVHLNIIETFAWMTLVWGDLLRGVVSRQRRFIVRAGLWLGLSLLCAHFQVTMYMLVGLTPLLIVVGRRHGTPLVAISGQMALAVLIGLALGAAQWGPTMAISGGTERGLRAQAFAAMGSLPATRLVDLLLPALDPNPDREHVVYPGVLVLVFGAAALARGGALRWALGGVALVALFFSLGIYGPLYEVITGLMPVLKSTRVPARAMMVGALAWVLLAGLALGDMRARPNTIRLARRWLCWMAVLGVLALIHGWAGTLSAGQVGGLRSRLGDSGVQIALIAGLGAAWLGLYLRERMGHGALLTGLAVLLTLDLTAPGLRIDLTPRGPALEVYEPRPMFDRLVQRQRAANPGAPFRVAMAGPPANAGLALGLDSSSGWVQVENLRRVVLEREMGRAAFWRWEGCRYIVHHQHQPGYRLVEQDGPWVLLQDPESLPLVWLAGDAQMLDGETVPQQESLSMMRDYPLLELTDGGPPPELALGAAQGRLEITQWTPGQMRMTADLPAPGLLVTTVTDYPGWSVQVNGAPGRLLRANAAYIAIPVDAGQSSIELRYRLPWLWPCIAVSLTALLAVVGFLVRPGTRDRSAEVAGDPPTP